MLIRFFLLHIYYEPCVKLLMAKDILYAIFCEDFAWTEEV